MLKAQIKVLQAQAKDAEQQLSYNKIFAPVAGRLGKRSVEVGARVFFVYNNPDDVLRKTVERSREVIEPFFKDTLALRMTGGKLRDVAPAKGWLGVRATLEIKPPGAPCVLDPMRTAWLPGERSAKAWAGFEK